MSACHVVTSGRSVTPSSSKSPCNLSGRASGGGAENLCPDDHGDDRRAPGQTGRQFEVHPIIREVQPPSAVLIARSKPAGPDHRQHYRGLQELVLHPLRPRAAHWHRIHVHEQLTRAKPTLQLQIKTLRFRTGVVPAITYERQTGHFVSPLAWATPRSPSDTTLCKLTRRKGLGECMTA